MLLVALAACSLSPLTEADVDAVPWAGEFTWDLESTEDLGLVDFALESDGEGGFTGEFHYADADSESVYALAGALEDGVLTLSQTAIVADLDLPADRVWCEGDYVLTMEDHALVGSYFPRTPECVEFTGSARFEVE